MNINCETNVFTPVQMLSAVSTSSEVIYQWRTNSEFLTSPTGTIASVSSDVVTSFHSNIPMHNMVQVARTEKEKNEEVLTHAQDSDSVQSNALKFVSE